MSSKDPTQIKDYWGHRVSAIDDNLYQGGFPYPIAQVPLYGIDVLVLAAREVQPRPEDIANLRRTYPDLRGVTVKMDDSLLKDDPTVLKRIAPMAEVAAHEITKHLKEGRKVLVTCSAGRNRSGFINALVLMRLRGLSGAEAVKQVQLNRDKSLPPGQGALTNTDFAAYLKALPARPRGNSE